MKRLVFYMEKVVLSCKEGVGMVVAAIGGNKFHVVVAIKEAVFAALTCLLLGLIIGTIRGGKIYIWSFHGVAIGAMVGGISALEFIELTVYGDTLSTVALIMLRGLVSGEFMSYAMFGVHRWLINTIDSRYREITDIYGIFEDNGVSNDIIQQLPKYKYKPTKTMVPGIIQHSCSICLQEFVEGDNMRRLPNCGHVFHLCCIDQWLRQKGLCPICRQCAFHEIETS